MWEWDGIGFAIGSDWAPHSLMCDGSRLACCRGDEMALICRYSEKSHTKGRVSQASPQREQSETPLAPCSLFGLLRCVPCFGLLFSLQRQREKVRPLSGWRIALFSLEREKVSLLRDQSLDFFQHCKIKASATPEEAQTLPFITKI